MRTIIFITLFVIATHTVKAQTSQYLQQIGVVDSIYSTTLNEIRSFYVEFPDSYQSNPDQKYPVAYILDGEIFLPILNNVNQIYSGGFMPEMVLIGISNATHRTRDLTPSKTSEGNGEAENFLKFIESELIPHVEKNYPVTNYRTLIGHSYGGLFSIYTLINKPQLFANYLAIDPSLDWDNQILLKQMDTILASANLSDKSLYMSLSGQLHWQDPNVTIDNVMEDTSDFTLFARSNMMFAEKIKGNTKSGLAFNWQFYPNDLHGTIPLPSIKDGMLETFQWYQMENTDKINNPETSIQEILTVISCREVKLKKHFGYRQPPYSETLFNMLGYMNLDMKQPEKSKMYFEQAIKYYPKSANAYDSMADYYESQKDYVNAIKFVTKAYEISGEEYYKSRIVKFETL